MKICLTIFTWCVNKCHYIHRDYSKIKGHTNPFRSHQSQAFSNAGKFLPSWNASPITKQTFITERFSFKELSREKHQEEFKHECSLHAHTITQRDSRIYEIVSVHSWKWIRDDLLYSPTFKHSSLHVTDTLGRQLRPLEVRKPVALIVTRALLRKLFLGAPATGPGWWDSKQDHQQQRVSFMQKWSNELKNRWIPTLYPLCVILAVSILAVLWGRCNYSPFYILLNSFPCFTFLHSTFPF